MTKLPTKAMYKTRITKCAKAQLFVLIHYENDCLFYWMIKIEVVGHCYLEVVGHSISMALQCGTASLKTFEMLTAY